MTSAPARPGPALVAGSAIHVVAPSGPVPTDRVGRGIAVLERAGFIVRRSTNLEHAEGYFAGDDATRLSALTRAMAGEAAAIWCARGGYGLTRLLDRLDPAVLRERPRPVLGFSDVTALLAWAWTHAGAMSLHAPVVTQLGELPPEDVEATLDWLRGEVPAPLEADPLGGTVLSGGTVEGPLLAGNVEVLRSLVGTGHLPSLEGAILAIEEVGERPYRIDRALTHLLASGALRGLRGVVVGQLHACLEPEHGGSQGWTAQEVIADRLGRLGVPVVTGFPFGHARDRNAPLPVGARVRLRADDGLLEFLEPVTA